MKSYRFRILWASLLLLGLFYPFLKLLQLTGLALLLNVITTLILISSIHAVGDNRPHLLVAVLLVAPAIFLNWTERFYHTPAIELASSFSQSVALGFVAIQILQYALRAGRVDAAKVDAAVCVYLLIGVIWKEFYIIVHHLIPGSFENPLLSDGDFLYFSFITLSTLGYGDITPLNEQAQALAYTEAILGQLYLTILVARLVGLYIAYSSPEGAAEAGAEGRVDRSGSAV